MLDEYRNHPSIFGMLKGGALLSQREFVSWYKPIETRSSNRLTKDFKSEIESENLEIAMGFLDEICDQVCRKIGEEYGQYALRKTANNLKKGSMENFDILVAVSEGYDKLKIGATKVVQAHKNKNIVGFIVVERGECRLWEKQVCVNLICVKEGTIKGSVLLGAYLYCLKASPLNSKGLLELAGSYSNLAGFFSYTKLGFDKDESLYDKKCFYNPENLPMSVQLNKYKKEDFIDLVTGKKKRGDFSDEVMDDTGLFAYGALKEESKQVVQEKIGRAYAIKQYLKMALQEPSGGHMHQEKLFLKLIVDIEPNDTNDMKLEKIDEYILLQKKKLSSSRGGKTRKKKRRMTTKWVIF